MKSIKPGRGPSMIGGIMGIFMILFGIVWTAIASRLNPIMLVFGILWTGIAIVQTVYSFKNATSQNRFSQVDITDAEEETDPLQEKYGENKDKPVSEKVRFCPYCGAPAEGDFQYCPKCGKKLP